MESAQRDKALIILIKSLFDQIDEVSNLLAQGKSATISKSILEEMAKILPELHEDTREKYYELLMVLSEHASPAKRKVELSDSYIEEVSHAKKKMIDALKEDLKIAI